MANKDEAMADVREMYVSHDMFRREFGQAARLVRAVENGDVRRADLVGGHIEVISLILDAHHSAEDLLLWPKILDRAGRDVKPLVHTMESQHADLHVEYEKVQAILPAWRRTGSRDRGGALANALDRLNTVLVEHTALEEARILPLVEKYVTAWEWAQLGDYGMRTFPKSKAPLALGLMMYEGDPDVIRTMLADAPPPARLIMPFIGRRIFARHAKRVYGTATPLRSTDVDTVYADLSRRFLRHFYASVLLDGGESTKALAGVPRTLRSGLHSPDVHPLDAEQ